MPEPSDFELPRTCVLTIQGGGAFGVELIGQLQGVTGALKTRGGQDTGDHGFIVAGISGSSAGAIIAALFWAGYTPSDILDIVHQVFSPAGRESFFGPYHPSENKSFTHAIGLLNEAKAVNQEPSDLSFFSGLFPEMRRNIGFFLYGWKALPVLRWIFARRGVFEADGFVVELDRLLKKSPKFRGDFERLEGQLTFQDVRNYPALDLPPLFLMVTDVASQELKIVSSLDDDLLDAPIALAVRASAGLPGFFRPVKLNNHICCVDGGVISNLPAWVFNKEYRARLREAGAAQGDDGSLAALARLPWHHISLTLAPDGDHQFDDSGKAYVKALWRLLKDVGRRQLEDRMSGLIAVKRFVVRPAPTARGAAAEQAVEGVGGALDFAALADAERVKALFDKGRATAQQSIKREIHKLGMPARESVLAELDFLAQAAECALKPYADPDRGLTVRANIFLPYRPTTLKIAYAVNMAGHIDEGLEITQGKAVTSLCYLYGAPLLANLADNRLDAQIPDGAEPFAVKAHSDRTWLMCAPILDPLDARPITPSTSSGFAMDFDGPVFGTLNLDANLRYGDGFLDPDPTNQYGDVTIRLMFSAMKTVAHRLGLLFNSHWLAETSSDARQH